MARDTDRDWKLIGDSDPYFGVLTHERFRLDKMTDATLDEFYASGRVDVARVLSRITAVLPDFRPRHALDFGCGAGRLVLAMAPHAGQVTGLDIAPGMLDRARDAAHVRKIGNVRFVGALEPDDSFDWINSFIVLQHMPPERGYALLSDLFDHLTVDGVCSVQMTLFRDRNIAGNLVGQGTIWSFDGETARALLPDDRDPPGSMGMYDYDLNRVLALMAARGIEPFAIAPTNHGGHRGVWLFARRPANEDALALGITYGATTEPGLQDFLGEGWSFMEDWGVWSDGPQATLDLRIDASHRRSHLLVLTGQGFLQAGAHEELTVTATINGKPAGTHQFTLQKRIGDLALPLTMVAAGGTVRVTLSMDAPRSPHECGIQGDMRLLGFGLHQIELRAKAPTS